MPDESLPADSLEEHLVPLDSTDPDSDLDDLAPLVPALADRTVVGLGEATHGSREFFQVKHRLIRFLVEEHRFRTLAFEADPVAARAVDDYVTRGDGGPREAVAGFHVWPWKVESVLALVEWLRAFNADRPLDDRVRFHGVDVQHTTGPVAELRSFLRRADPGYLDTVDGALTAADDDARRGSEIDDADRLVAAADRLGDDLDARLRDREDEYVAATDRAAWDRARQHVRTVSRAGRYKAALADDDLGRAMTVRDRTLADNVAWLADRAQGEGVAVWAHNAHVNRVERRSSGETAPSMGTHLADRYGDGYYAMAFEFGGGRFQAIAESERGDGGDGEGTDGGGDDGGGEYALRECVLPAPLSGTVGETLAGLDGPPFDGPALALDFESARADSAMARWLDAEWGLHSVGAIFRGADPDHHVERYHLGEAFDGLCYVMETTRARPLSE